jgi:hypothetical protein
MLHVKTFKTRSNAAGEVFNSLILEGIVFVKSKETGFYYATLKTASLPTTLSEEECKRLVGQSMAGKVKRVDCDPYEVVNEKTGETITLSHRYLYFPEGDEQTHLPESMNEFSETEEEFIH